MRKTSGLWMLVALTGAAFAASPGQAIRQVLDEQQSAWNRGDLRAFVEGYDRDAVFVGDAIQRGSAQVLARYLKRYPNRETMGKLTFSDLEVHMLGPGHAYVIGRFHLERSAAGGGNASGVYTLLFHKTSAGWKIILDHTSP